VTASLTEHKFSWPPDKGAGSKSELTRDVEWINYMKDAIAHYEPEPKRRRGGRPPRRPAPTLKHVWLAHKKQAAPVASRRHPSVWMLSTSKLVKSGCFPMLEYFNPL